MRCKEFEQYNKKIIEKQIVCISCPLPLLNHKDRTVSERDVEFQVSFNRGAWMGFLWIYELYPLTNQYDSTTDCNKPL